MIEQTTDNMVVKFKLVTFIALIFTVASLSFTIAGIIFTISSGEDDLIDEVAARKTNDKENEAMILDLVEDFKAHIEKYHESN